MRPAANSSHLLWTRWLKAIGSRDATAFEVRSHEVDLRLVVRMRRLPGIHRCCDFVGRLFHRSTRGSRFEQRSHEVAVLLHAAQHILGVKAQHLWIAMPHTSIYFLPADGRRHGWR